MVTFPQLPTSSSSLSLLLLSLSLSSFLTTTVDGRFSGDAGEDNFQCFKCEADSEKTARERHCGEIQACTGVRPVCAKLEFSGFFHGIMGTKTLKFCYDLSLEQASKPLDEIDLCDVAHHDFHGFTLEARSHMGTVCDNKHSTWHRSYSCTTSLCNVAADRRRPRSLPILATIILAALFLAHFFD